MSGLCGEGHVIRCEGCGRLRQAVDGVLKKCVFCVYGNKHLNNSYNYNREKEGLK